MTACSILLPCLIPLLGDFGLPRTVASSNGKKHAEAPEYREMVPLEFTLMDAYGRQVCASDYRGVPVLISTGACWCGGCQSEAEPLRLLAEKYGARGLQVIRSVSYDSNLPAWEFQKHYRLPFVQLLDPIREFERHYNGDGWSFFMLADRDGKVIFRTNRSNWSKRTNRPDWSELTRLLEATLPERSPVRTIEREGVSYMPATLKRSGETKKLRHFDRFPSLACADDGRVYVAFTTNRNGTQDVYLRTFDGHNWLPERPLAATEADEFDGTVIVDRENRPWVAWTSNASGGAYNIFVTCAAESLSKNPQIQVTHSDPKDGTMHPRMAVDAKGRIWLTYYQWERIYGISRDKEVYTRFRELDRWSDEIHVSPEDIPVFEDHTDPVIAPLGSGVVIGWSWDFHHQNSCPQYSSVPDAPSIFLRKVAPGPVFERARAVSGPNVDSRPAIAVGPQGRIFCAWESALMGRYGARRRDAKLIATSVEDLDGKEHPGTGTDASGLRADVCTPCLAASPKGDVVLLWAEPDPQNRWTLKQTHWIEKKHGWAEPKALVSKGNPRFPSAAFSKDGSLWVAYCVDKGERREVAVLRAGRH